MSINKKCNSCGANVDEKQNFCSNCGAPLNSISYALREEKNKAIEMNVYSELLEKFSNDLNLVEYIKEKLMSK